MGKKEQSEKTTIEKPKPTGLIVMGVVLVLLIGGYFGITAYNRAQAAKASNEESTTKIMYSTATANVTELHYTYGGVLYTYEKKDDKWVYTDDPSLNIDSDKIRSMVSYLASVYYYDVLTEVTDYDQYGLESDYVTLGWTADGTSYELRLGSYNPVTSSYYFMNTLNGDVYITTQNLVDYFKVVPEDIVVVEEDDAEEVEDTEGEETEVEATDDAEANEN